MNIQKSQLQRLQSRISKRRGEIYDMERLCQKLYDFPALKMSKKIMWQKLKEIGDSQKLDKELFQLLLKQERNKYAGYFRSKYVPVKQSSPVGRFSAFSLEGGM